MSIENARRTIEYDPEKPRQKQISKEDLYSNLQVLMEQGNISLLDDPEIAASLRSVQYEYDEETGNLKIFGRYTHIAEGLIRACWCVKDKSLNLYIY